jgi:hypothetical protein
VRGNQDPSEGEDNISNYNSYMTYIEEEYDDEYG